MSKLITLLLVSVSLMACSSTPEKVVEPKVITVTKMKSTEGINPEIPSRPAKSTIRIKPSKLEVITPDVILKRYMATLDKEIGDDLSPEAKKMTLEQFEVFFKLASNKNPFAYIAYTTDQYADHAELLQEVLRWMREANARFDYVDSTDLVIPVRLEEESSGTD